MAKVFDEEFIARVPLDLQNSSRFVHKLVRWTHLDGLQTHRSQIEAAWATLAPEERDSNLLGLLRGKDNQHFSATSVLFAGLALRDTGWSVEFEPRLPDGRTPDLRIRKPDVDLWVEAVAPDIPTIGPHPDDTNRFRDAISGLTSRFGIFCSKIEIPRKTEPRSIRAHFEKALQDAEQGDSDNAYGHYREDGVSIAYELRRFPRELTKLYCGTPSLFFSGSPGLGTVKEAIAKKVRKYQQPMYILLSVTGMDTPGFEAIDEALFGTWGASFAVGGSGETTPFRGGGMLFDNSETGEVLREHLLGVIGVRMYRRETHYDTCLHIFHTTDHSRLRGAFHPFAQNYFDPHRDAFAGAPLREITEPPRAFQVRWDD